MYQGTKEINTADNKKAHKGRNRILLQIGTVIILLFVIITFLVSNMVIMASFSASLTAKMYSVRSEIFLKTEDEMGSCETMPWLMEY